MKDGFIKVGAVTPLIEVANCKFNQQQIIESMTEAAKAGVKILVFPELCLTGYTCGELFLQETLLTEAMNSLKDVAKGTSQLDIVVVVGLPMTYKNKLYNVAAVIHKGKVIGFVPKKHLPNYSEFYEMRHFNPGYETPVMVTFDGYQVPFGMNILFKCTTMKSLVFAVEICEDLWVANPPSIRHTAYGATLMLNLSASDETTGKDIYRRQLVTGQSGRLICGYIYADAGEGESSTDLVFAGHNIIAENGTMVSESKRFENSMITGEIDLDRICAERRRMTTYEGQWEKDTYVTVPFSLSLTETTLTKHISQTPFVPSSIEDRNRRCEEILNIQAMGLKKRLCHTHCQSAVIGISGGLDSTLALLVTVRAFEKANMDLSQIKAVTMPCFGTTDRTYHNACTLVEKLGATLIEVDIKPAVLQHFKDIGQSEDIHDVTYENSQARERTQVLMDIANKEGGMVIGTGDLSELALGWATYNGDHMSMYGVNSSIPKTLVRHLVSYYADTSSDKALAVVLKDILDTPVSPELIPPKDGTISQKTEDLVGPYELHDFFLYYMMRFGFAPEKIFRLAVYAFDGVYKPQVIHKWLTTFYRRFFAQQFKRSCLPDGPKVGTVALSPRGDWRMPSDASVKLWLDRLEQIKL